MIARTLSYFLIALLIAVPFIASRKRWRTMKEATNARLKEKFFPYLIDNLKSLNMRLSEEDVDGEGFVKLLNKGWKSFWILDFRKFYGLEAEAFVNFKKELEKYEEDTRKLMNTRDERLKEKTLKRKIHIRNTLSILITRLENLM